MHMLTIHDLPRRDTGTPEVGSYAVASPSEIGRDIRRYANSAMKNGQANTGAELMTLSVAIEALLQTVDV